MVAPAINVPITRPFSSPETKSNKYFSQHLYFTVTVVSLPFVVYLMSSSRARDIDKEASTVLTVQGDLPDRDTAESKIKEH